MKLEDIHQSKIVREIVIGIGVIILVLCILFVGINIGEHRARFAGQFGDNFERNFLGPRDGMMGGGYFGGMMPGGHGAIGEIISLNLPQLIVTGPDNLEKTVLISTSTIIRQFQTNIQSSELKVGDFVVVLGNPNENGQIEAKLIRVMPNPSQEITKPK
jgi:hypothetical protein